MVVTCSGIVLRDIESLFDEAMVFNDKCIHDGYCFGTCFRSRSPLIAS